MAEEVESCKKPLEVKNTQNIYNVGSVCVLLMAGKEHNNCSEEKCPSEVLCMEDKALVCHWLCIFVKEARRKNGEEQYSEWAAAIHQFKTGAAQAISEVGRSH